MQASAAAHARTSAPLRGGGYTQYTRTKDPHGNRHKAVDALVAGGADGRRPAREAPHPRHHSQGREAVRSWVPQKDVSSGIPRLREARGGPPGLSFLNHKQPPPKGLKGAPLGLQRGDFRGKHTHPTHTTEP